MTDLAPLLSSDRMDWATPQAFFDRLDAEFGFDLDVCATDRTAKCQHYYTPEDDGLAMPWAPLRCYCNPPYGREIARWIERCSDEARRGALVVALIPARTDTRYWHDVIMQTASEVRLVKGRLRFDDGSNPAPFPSAVIVWWPFACAGGRPLFSTMPAG